MVIDESHNFRNGAGGEGIKLFDRPNERCGKEEWRAIEDAAPSVVPYYFTTLILASVSRFSDYCWEATSGEKNVKLVQIQTLNQV